MQAYTDCFLGAYIDTYPSLLLLCRHRYIYIYDRVVNLKKMKAVCWLLVLFGLMMQVEMTTLLPLARDVSTSMEMEVELNHEVDWLLANAAADPINVGKALLPDKPVADTPSGKSYQRGCQKSHYC
ncbi:hypothetical protein IHE45_08G005900 [Dioscorea alata]|uniref:Uncharacterized protein n=1 Tax=Dioscorea alata TaxID=55571 RepID=A0ACB7VH66_DIOAL|nr:hypothetical protein IHE45_08G005900 [Dioscorea alata]